MLPKSSVNVILYSPNSEITVPELNWTGSNSSFWIIAVTSAPKYNLIGWIDDFGKVSNRDSKESLLIEYDSIGESNSLFIEKVTIVLFPALSVKINS